MRLTTETCGLIDVAALAALRAGTILTNTARGALIDYRAVYNALATGQLGVLGSSSRVTGSVLPGTG